MLGIELAKQTVVLMGICFMLGSLFTIFVLLILEMLRSWHEAQDALAEEAAHDTVESEGEHA